MHLRTTRASVVALLALTLTGCGPGRAPSAPQIRVTVGDQRVNLQASQYCADGTGRKYDIKPPVIVAAPNVPIAFTVPDQVARQGWQVQVFDQHFEQPIGDVHVDPGKAVFDRIGTSDVVPAAFYLVVVEDKSPQCHYLSGSWPVGIIRANPDAGSATPTSGAAPSGTPSPSGSPSPSPSPTGSAAPSAAPSGGMPTG